VFEHLRITLDEWRRLGEHTGRACISLYMPMIRAGRETRQNATRFKNCLGEVERGMIGRGIQRAEIESTLAALAQAADTEEFWRHRGEGLVVFMEGANVGRWAITPLRLPQTIVVSRRFQLTPLLPLVLGDGLFYVVIASQNEVELLECTRDGFVEMHLDQIPHGREVIDRYVEESRQLQAQSVPGAAPSRGRQAVMFHGQGGPDRNDKARIFEYFRAVDEVLGDLIGRERAAAVFAGVDYLFPIYRQANRSLHLVDEFVRGNFDQVRADLADIHAQAWKIVQPHFTRNHGEELGLLREAIAKKQGSTDIGEIVEAGRAGLIEHLAVNPSVQQWGIVDEETGRISEHGQNAELEEDLINLATILAVRSNAIVTTLGDDEFELGGRAIAAAFRTSVSSLR